jgi:peptidoglycan/LPS O-acetylase OafA/YrhL
MPNDLRLRLHFLDALRGLAALYVLLFHEAGAKVTTSDPDSASFGFLRAILDQGRHSVVFFIVLSGFSLMLPIVRSGDGQLVGGLGRFVRRRAKRILPPYYAALFASLALIVAYNRLASRMGGEATLDAALQPGSIVSHLLLVHNLKFDWAFRINGPMWSVATEWQIYFVFALLLLPLWRKLGGPIAVVLAWVVTALPAFVLPAESSLYWASPWFLGSFALGAYGAELAFKPQLQSQLTKLPWPILTWIAFAVVVLTACVGSTWPYPLVDFTISVFAVCWIVACVQLSKRAEPKRSLMLRVLEWRPFVYLGGFSYSLYLVQHPLLRLSEKVFNRMGLSRDLNLLLHLVAVTPIVLLVAWFFSELFERPFTTDGVILPAIRRRLGGARRSL